MVTKECPLCGEMMQLREREVTDRVPGFAQTNTTRTRSESPPQRAPSVSNSSLRTASSTSSRLSAVSHSSHSSSWT